MESQGRVSGECGTFSCVQEIKHLSELFSRGSCVTKQRECLGCKWSFIANVRRDGIGLMLNRDDGGRSNKSAKVRLSVVDRFGRACELAEKNVRFECASYTESVLYLQKDDLLSRYWGLSRLLYVPKDTLTLKWEITTYSHELVEFGSRTPCSFWSNFIVQCLLVFVLIITASFLVMIAIGVYKFLESLVIQTSIAFFAAVYAIQEIMGEILPFILIIAFFYGMIRLDRFANSGRRTNQVTQYIVVERRQIALRNNGGVARYETMRSMSYTNNRFYYPDANRHYRIQQ